jgi:hypothetical protein
MANNQFLENQQMQNSKLTLMWGIMTKEQRQRVREERQQLVTKKPQTGDLVDLSTPPLTPVSSVEVGQILFSCCDGLNRRLALTGHVIIFRHMENGWQMGLFIYI